jgi:GTP-binding protein
MKILSADFVKTAKLPADYPAPEYPEVAFSGRSNVGKSSLINSLVQRHKLARVSAKPGHTRALNFYLINGRYSFTDLPGYGYARVADAERAEWKTMVETYLGRRSNLKAVVVIVDIRRGPEEEERHLIGYLRAQQTNVVLVATKADKLGKNQRVRPLRDMAAALALPPGAVIPYSAETGEGRELLWKRLRAHLEEGVRS